MNPSDIQLDLLNILYIPLVIITFVEIKRNWTSLWDDRVTVADSALLQRIVLFVLIPIVVLFHECGHAFATMMLGGRVDEFHYSLFWGFVKPSANLSALQMQITALAGNLVQIVIGLLSLIVATFLTSPPLVTLFVYLGLWSIGGTVILYTLMSFSGLYGDWAIIYFCPDHVFTPYIAMVHIVLVVLVFYALYGKAPKLWFLSKTDQRWYRHLSELLLEVKQENSLESHLALAWCYLERNFVGQALEQVILLKREFKLDASGEPEIAFLEVACYYQKRNFKQALKVLNKLELSDPSDGFSLLRLNLAKADCLIKLQNYAQAVAILNETAAIFPEIADPHFYLALSYRQSGQIDLARLEQAKAMQLSFVNASLTKECQYLLE